MSVIRDNLCKAKGFKNTVQLGIKRMLSAVKAGSVFFGRICTSVRTPLRAPLLLSNYLTT